ncbi:MULTISPECIES: hypothetical protein [unclassified Legionella]|uniref:hypothetical protein n=1 Tax=unclassified Legionella TaxID=2622702 RepID=UPI00105652C2|nr:MULTISPECIES: hypothetical protein [unclassified Legionella]MDI9819149.1 hypothetical protein [Legionella sp. PL877]
MTKMTNRYYQIISCVTYCEEINDPIREEDMISVQGEIIVEPIDDTRANKIACSYNIHPIRKDIKTAIFNQANAFFPSLRAETSPKSDSSDKCSNDLALHGFTS